MSRTLARISVLAVMMPLASTGTRADDDWYRLEFDGPTHLVLLPEGTVEQDYVLRIGHTGPGVSADSDGDGVISEGERGSAQSWSVSLIAEGGEITRIQSGMNPDDDVETDASRLFTQGFERSELTSGFQPGSECDGQRGAMSAVMLSFYEVRMLPANRSSSIAVITVEAPSESGGGLLRLRYVDGCRGSGEPVQNVVTHLGESRYPIRKSLEVTLGREGEALECGDAPRNYGFSTTRLRSADTADAPLDSVLGVQGRGRIVQIPWNTEGSRATVYANIVSQYLAGGPGRVQGWSIAVGLDGNGAVAEATTSGTSAAQAPDGLLDGGFQSLAIVNPDGQPWTGPLAGTGPQGPGVVSAIVLAFLADVTLPPRGAESVLKLTVEIPPWVGPQANAARCLFRDGLQSGGEPVLNLITVEGQSQLACNKDLADLTIQVLPLSGAPFVRGNANGDSRVNIADPIWIVQELFHEGPASTCQDASDSNDDGVVDLSDAAFLIDYIFRGGSSPPAPFGACGSDPDGDADGLTCSAAPAMCMP